MAGLAGLGDGGDEVLVLVTEATERFWASWVETTVFCLTFLRLRSWPWFTLCFRLKPEGLTVLAIGKGGLHRARDRLSREVPHSEASTVKYISGPSLVALGNAGLDLGWMVSSYRCTHSLKSSWNWKTTCLVFGTWSSKRGHAIHLIIFLSRSVSCRVGDADEWLQSRAHGKNISRLTLDELSVDKNSTKRSNISGTKTWTILSSLYRLT